MLGRKVLLLKKVPLFFGFFLGVFFFGIAVSFRFNHIRLMKYI